MKRLVCGFACILMLQIAWGRALPKWVRNCSQKIQVEEAQIKKGKILACGVSEALSSDMDYSLSLAKHNALEKIMNALNSDRLEIKASKIKATFIGASQVYVLVEVTQLN
ncbi:hypothetical protein [Helicobacter cetorum]|uniref:Uncharacterized protein n=1 Tax=Helicobacter cetorum (strain ATCC BAA-540 / CCUG 52418 / MIT 99-5656) TaxID=1163745 RepID=I0EQI7_HELCM|nr:hypothetical protein [Helicobacter cetorum]AFI05206.1 hypothetical protein HCD_00870 [Helicobacter cetorum MIT 99-5656]